MTIVERESLVDNFALYKGDWYPVKPFSETVLYVWLGGGIGFWFPAPASWFGEAERRLETCPHCGQKIEGH